MEKTISVSDETLAKIRAERPGEPVMLATCSYAEVVFRMPTEEEWDRYLTERESIGSMRALKPLFCSCALFPKYGSAEFTKMVKAKPAVIQKLGGQLQDWAGLEGAAEKKEL